MTRSTPSLSSGRHGSRSRRNASSSGRPKVAFGPESSEKEKYKSRIQLVEDTDDDDNDDKAQAATTDDHNIGCSAQLYAIRKAARLQQKYERQLGEEEQKKPLALWLSLDPSTGEVSLYPRAAATRLESAYVNNRSSVPLAGLGGSLEDDIVYLGSKSASGHPVQKSWHGGQIDVRRLQVGAVAGEVFVNVALQDHEWRIVDKAEPGQTEQRRLVLNGTEMVRPPTPPLPPLNPDRRINFCNLGADGWGC